MTTSTPDLETTEAVPEDDTRTFVHTIILAIGDGEPIECDVYKFGRVHRVTLPEYTIVRDVPNGVDWISGRPLEGKPVVMKLTVEDWVPVSPRNYRLDPRKRTGWLDQSA